MHCPACARPVAMAGKNCIYCAAPLSQGAQEAAALAARRVLQSKSLMDLESAATSRRREQAPRRYVVIDSTAASVESIAAACSVSAWEARQWQAASRYRLVRVSAEPPDGPLERRLQDHGLAVLVVDEDAVARARHPIRLESIDTSRTPAECTVRNDPEAPPMRRQVPEQDLALIVSASIRREKVKDLGSAKKAADVRLEDAVLVHLYSRGESRPFELDPRRTVFEGQGLASAHMRTLEFVRRLSLTIPHDDGFRNVVPALGPGLDPLTELISLNSPPKSSANHPKLVVLDNVTQFREYSAWRGALALAHPSRA